MVTSKLHHWSIQQRPNTLSITWMTKKIKSYPMLDALNVDVFVCVSDEREKRSSSYFRFTSVLLEHRKIVFCLPTLKISIKWIIWGMKPSLNVYLAKPTSMLVQIYGWPKIKCSHRYLNTRIVVLINVIFCIQNIHSLSHLLTVFWSEFFTV